MPREIPVCGALASNVVEIIFGAALGTGLATFVAGYLVIRAAARRGVGAAGDRAAGPWASRALTARAATALLTQPAGELVTLTFDSWIEAIPVAHFDLSGGAFVLRAEVLGVEDGWIKLRYPDVPGEPVVGGASTTVVVRSEHVQSVTLGSARERARGEAETVGAVR